MDNIRSDQRRAEFYANRVLCALRHITDIVQHMHRSGGFSHTEVQELETRFTLPEEKRGLLVVTARSFLYLSGAKKSEDWMNIGMKRSHSQSRCSLIPGAHQI